MSKASKTKSIRILVSKPGLDGHDVGAKLLCRALMDAGMEVVYTGLRQSPESIAKTALEESVDVVGCSILSGAHLSLCKNIGEKLKESSIEDVLWIVGGNIPKRDHENLFKMGINGIFPTDTPFEKIVDFIKEKVQQ